MYQALFTFLEKHLTLTDEEKILFSQMDIIRQYSKGQYLLKEGQVATQYYFILQGCLRVYYLKDGEEITTALCVEEQSVIPSSLETGLPSKYNIVCMENCTILSAAPSMEAAVFEKHPQFERLCRILAEKELVKVRTDHETYVTSDAETRYLQLLEQNPSLFQRVPQYHIASLLGIKPETLSRIRKRLSQ